MQVLHTRDADFAERWTRLCARGSDEDEAPVREAAARIVADVRARGDEALLVHTRRLDGWSPASAAELVAGPADLRAAWRSLPSGARNALGLAARRIEAFHRRETDSVVPLFRDALGVRLAQVSRPLSRVGLYVPGGTARYPSTVLMTAVPARVAGVGEVVACSPADRATGAVDAWTLAACHAAGVSRLYKVGGAQAVAALAYGTATVTAVDKICGPGNAYVAAAKRLVYGRVDIDMIAGPSEVLVVADRKASPAEAAADLIAQAEHDPRAVAVLLASSQAVARSTLVEVERQLQDLPRAGIARRSLEERGAAVVARDVAEAVRLADEFAPEHLVMLVQGAGRFLPRLSRAGAVFLGSATPEAAGDYLAGPSHVLPTAGTARFASPLSVATFRRRMSVLELPARALSRLAPAIEALTAAEGLEGHARAVRVRLGPGGTGAGRRRRAPRAVRRKGMARP
ncbi:MAG TPA: histidinol dehydrogenase [Anaeromyxobacteraceae bacterium]|nr:histidinol dehydrogenase [Anaeromyxobacteraceae bacterium]